MKTKTGATVVGVPGRGTGNCAPTLADPRVVHSSLLQAPLPLLLLLVFRGGRWRWRIRRCLRGGGGGFFSGSRVSRSQAPFVARGVTVILKPPFLWVFGAVLTSPQRALLSPPARRRRSQRDRKPTRGPVLSPAGADNNNTAPAHNDPPCPSPHTHKHTHALTLALRGLPRRRERERERSRWGATAETGVI